MRCSVAATALFLDPRVEEGLVFIVVHRLRRVVLGVALPDPPRRERSGAKAEQKLPTHIK